MTVRTLGELSILVLGVTLVLLCAGIAAAKVAGEHARRRREQRRAELRPVLLEALEDGDLAVELPRRLGDDELDTIVGLLGHLRGGDRTRLASVLERRGELDAATSRLRSRGAARRRAAAELLGATGHRPAAPDLVLRLADRDRSVRISAARALGRIGSPSAVPALAAALESGRVPANTVSMAILRIGPGAAPGLVPFLVSPVPRMRVVAAELVGSLGHTESAPTVEGLLSDPEQLVREAAAHGLGRLASPASVVPLSAALVDALGGPVGAVDEPTAVAIVQALGQIGDRRSIPVLTGCLARTYRISRAASDALEPMGQRRSQASEAARAATGSTDRIPGETLAIGAPRRASTA